MRLRFAWIAWTAAGMAGVLAAAAGTSGAQQDGARSAAATASAQQDGARSAAATASAQQDGARSAAATDAGEERPLDAEPFPAEPSKQPTAAEWKAAPRVRLSRTGPAAAGCRAYRMREWLRIRCPELTVSAISLLGGKTEGVAFWIDPPRGGSELPRGGEVMFPIRRGDRRVIQILTFGPGYDGPFTLLPAIVVQEQWLDDEPAPTVTAS
ncbi:MULTISPECIES: hypothetical protein [Sorangium]|uniref:Secreted protein n=1 Tax=Sorangium cellulosum TaxID=56 RepID=A0A4P2QSE2_SORCE|nr:MULTISPECIES: hypothetical protein [Sorangium]AUX32956.1 hypothetical protein SOCE836_051080 [Sorangium cellulosum]WCQ92332.1 hypothetical protein NQZ70_05073 [Sorangium sp. Soce836]